MVIVLLLLCWKWDSSCINSQLSKSAEYSISLLFIVVNKYMLLILYCFWYYVQMNQQVVWYVYYIVTLFVRQTNTLKITNKKGKSTIRSCF